MDMADRAFNVAERWLRPGTLVIVDDYNLGFQNDKSPMTRPVVDKLCDLGYLETWAIVNGETWFGRVKDVDKSLPGSQFLTNLLPQAQV